MTQNDVIVFDLDDTLYKEIDFLKSAYREVVTFIGHEDAYNFMLETYYQHGNPFDAVISKYKLDLTIPELLDVYRKHKPQIVLDKETRETLNYLHVFFHLGIITDGRSVTQNNKIEALALCKYINKDNIIISEEFGFAKPSEEGFVYFMKKYPLSRYIYVADNQEKDFIAPNKLGWQTICLMDDGRNIHHNNNVVGMEYCAKCQINNIKDLLTKI